MKDIAIGAESQGFDSRAGQTGHKSCQRLATSAKFLQNCVALALSRGDGYRHSSHPSTYNREYNEGLIFFAAKVEMKYQVVFRRFDAVLQRRDHYLLHQI